MHSIDVGIVILIGGMALWGGMKGVVRILCFLGGMAFGLIAAQLWYPNVSDMLASVLQDAWLRDLVAFGGIFLTIQLLVQLLIRGIRKVLKETATSWLDRLAGLLLGAAMALLLIHGVRLVLHIIPLPLDSFFEDSRLWPAVLSMIDWCLSLLTSGG
jgi:membrane protein required for colicin V production